MPTGWPRFGASASADLMVGIPSFGNAETIGYVVRATTAGMVQYFPELKPILVNSDGGSPDDTPRVAVSTESPDYLEKVILVSPRHKLQRISVTYQGTSGKGTAVRALFEVARELKVKAMVMVDSDLRSIVPEWVELLAGPILKGGYDFVAPMYARYKYDGTITNNISYPLTRALYGARIRQPIGGDFARLRRPRRALSRARHVRRSRRALRDRHLDDALAPSTRASPCARPASARRSTTPRTRPATSGRCSARSSAPCSSWPATTRTDGCASGLAPDPRVRLRARRGAGGDQRSTTPSSSTTSSRRGSTQQRTWAEMLAPEQLERVMSLEIGARSRPTSTSLPSCGSAASTTRLVAFHRPGTDRERLLAALTPLYFGRTAGFISETLRA